MPMRASAHMRQPRPAHKCQPQQYPVVAVKSATTCTSCSSVWAAPAPTAWRHVCAHCTSRWIASPGRPSHECQVLPYCESPAHVSLRCLYVGRMSCAPILLLPGQSSSSPTTFAPVRWGPDQSSLDACLWSAGGAHYGGCAGCQVPAPLLPGLAGIHSGGGATVAIHLLVSPNV